MIAVSTLARMSQCSAMVIAVCTLARMSLCTAMVIAVCTLARMSLWTTISVCIVNLLYFKHTQRSLGLLVFQRDLLIKIPCSRERVKQEHIIGKTCSSQLVF